MSEKEARLKGDRGSIEGDFYAGAYGPTLLLVLDSIHAAKRLRSIFLAQAERNDGHELTADIGTVNHIASIGLLTEGEKSILKVKLVDDAPASSFILTASSEGWMNAADLLNPFCIGQKGHQFVADGVGDDAVFEVSFGESLKRPAKRSPA